jgi:hypothetical protein
MGIIHPSTYCRKIRQELTFNQQSTMSANSNLDTVKVKVKGFDLGSQELPV